METAILFLIPTWLIFAIIAAIIANSKGGTVDGWTFFFYGLFLGPIAIAHAIVRHRTLESEQHRHRLAGRIACLLCDEYISPKAVVCPFCQRDIVNWKTQKEQSESADVNAEHAESPDERPASETNAISADSTELAEEQTASKAGDDKMGKFAVLGLMGLGIIIILILIITSQ